MSKIEIATVEACAPAPFTSRPFLALVLANQVGTAARYVQMMPADASMDEMDAEARALEMTGEIDQAELASSWKLDQDEIDAEDAHLEANLAEDGHLGDGPQTVEDDIDESVEPVA